MGTLAEPVTAPLTAGPCGPGEPNELLTAALAYAARGWPVFPLADRDKVPRPGSRGFKDATCDREQIARWWAEHPHANIGIATGGGLLVVDVDGDEGRAPIQGKHLPPTVCAMTARGCHYFFAGDGRCMTGLLPGIDIRGAGGYVVAAPSVHPTGAAYCWAPGLSPDDLPLAPAPDWLTEAATPAPARRADARLPEPEACPPATCTASTPYGFAALKAACAIVAAALSGMRNRALNEAAYACGRLVGGGELSWADAWHELWSACRVNGLLVDPADGVAKTASTLRRALEDGMANPRRAPLVRIDRRLLNASLKPAGLFYGALLAMTHGRASCAHLASLAHTSERNLHRWKAEVPEGLMSIAAEVPARRFVAVPASLLLADLEPGAKALYVHVAALADGGRAEVGQEALVDRTGIPSRTLKRHLAALVQAGWIVCSVAKFCKAAGRRLGVNVYHLADTRTPAAVGLVGTNRTRVAHRDAAEAAEAPQRTQVARSPRRTGSRGELPLSSSDSGAVGRSMSSKKTNTTGPHRTVNPSPRPEKSPRAEESQNAPPALPTYAPDAGERDLSAPAVDAGHVEVPADILQTVADCSGVALDELAPEFVRALEDVVARNGIDELRALLNSPKGVLPCPMT